MLLNYAGRSCAVYFQLPLWLDAFGTVIAAYKLGPVCGSIVGVAGNIICGIDRPTDLVYSVTSIAIAVIVGIASKKKKLENYFEICTVSVIVTFASVVVSVPLNCLFADGEVGNVWGEGVASFLYEEFVPDIICIIAGQFYIDFLDKMITIVSIFSLRRLFIYLRRQG